MPSLKCLNDNYLPLSGGTLTGALTATKFTGDASGLTSIPAGKLTGTVDAARLPDLSGKYLPISGGTITGDTTIKGSSGQYAVKFINGDIQFLGDGGSAVISTISGISSSKGTSTTRAMSEKGVADNYIAKTDISNAKGTDTTKVPSLKCLNDNYVSFKNCPVLKQNLEIPVSEYSFILENNGDNLVANEKSISINDNMNLHTLRIDSNKITYTDTDSTKNWTFAGTVVSTTDLIAGTSALPSNQLYIVYE